MYRYSQKNSGCNTGLNSSQAMIMSVRPYPANFIKNLRHVVKKIPSSGLRFKHENIVFTNTTHAKNFLWIALEPNCNMYALTPLWKPYLHTIMTAKSLFGLTVV